MKKILLGTAGLLVSGSLLAAAMPVQNTMVNPWYVGVGINHPTVFTDRFDSSNKLDQTRIGFNVLAGYKFCDHWAQELGFSYFGKRTYKENGAKQHAKDTWLLAYDIVGTLPIAQYFGLFGKAGVDYYTQKGAEAHHNEGSYDSSARLRTFGANFGGGLAFNYEQFGARLGYTNYEEFLESSTADAYQVPNVLSLDFLYHFG